MQCHLDLEPPKLGVGNALNSLQSVKMSSSVMGGSGTLATID
jgi:hypothetical protein